jgi:hypothetical protein
MNCLAYALRFWKEHPHYRLYYNSDHVVNARTVLGGEWLPAEDYGYDYFQSAFAGLLDVEEQELLKQYFNQ